MGGNFSGQVDHQLIGMSSLSSLYNKTATQQTPSVRLESIPQIEIPPDPPPTSQSFPISKELGICEHMILNRYVSKYQKNAYQLYLNNKFINLLCGFPVVRKWFIHNIADKLHRYYLKGGIPSSRPPPQVRTWVSVSQRNHFLPQLSSSPQRCTAEGDEPVSKKT